MRRALPVLAMLAACTTLDDPTTDTDTDDTTDTDTDTDTTDDTDVDAWFTVAEDLPASLLSITGTGTDDVWTVGADAGTGPQALHFDGSSWKALEVASDGDLWWVWRGPDQVAWFAGKGGRVIRYDLADDSSVAEVLDPAVTLFGIWGTSEDDLWAVGGNISLSANGAALFHREEGAWTEVELPAGAASKFAMYKVWGSSATDVWICGIGGAIAHFDGDGWSDVESGTDRDLFTVSGAGTDEAYAVGGIASAAITRWNGTAWTDESPDFAPQFNGVSMTSDGPVAAGRTGEIWHRAEDGSWARDGRGIASFKDFHATWVDPDGGIWAVGGKLSSNTEGTLVYGGSDTIPAYAP